MIMKEQVGNVKFLRTTTRMIVDEFLNYLDKLNEDGQLNHEKIVNSVDEESKMLEVDNRQNKLTVEDNFEANDSNDLMNLKASAITLLMRLNAKYEDSLNNPKNNYLTEEVRWLISFVRKQLILEVLNRRVGENLSDIESLSEHDLKQLRKSDDVTKVLLELVFDSVFKEILRLNTHDDFVKIVGKEKCVILKEKCSYKPYITKYVKFLQGVLLRESSVNKQLHEEERFQVECSSHRNSMLK